jgi:3D (Asp-Asp-Asp) domain-containing protein
MFRMNLLAAAFSMLVAVAEEFSLFKEETPVDKIEEPAAEWHLVAPNRTITKLDQEPAKETFTVSASVYYPVPGQTDSTPYITADGSRINKNDPKKHRWLAVSRDLHSRWGGEISYGDSLHVTGLSDELDGLYIVRDVMNQRIRNRIDILVGQQDDVMGYWKGVKVAKLN